MYDDPEKLFVDEPLACRIDLQGRVFSFNTKIEDVQAKGIVIEQPELIGHALSLGQEILVRYFRQDSAYQFLSCIREIFEQSGKKRLLLSFPARITRLQRRAYKRALFEGTVRFRTELDGSRTFDGILRSLSSGGLRFSAPRLGMLTNPPQCIGRNLSLACKIEEQGEFYATSNIRRVAQDPQELTSVLVQVEFIDLEPKVSRQLNDLVAGKLKDRFK